MEEARQACATADAVLIAAGAGMGVDSGLPDFRGNEGFWNAYPPYRRLGYPFVEMASPARFEDDPGIGWGFYGHRLNLYRETRPHQGFGQLLDWGLSRPGGYFVFTSNVDGHFQATGFPEDRIVECHGSIHHVQCFSGCGEAIWEAKDLEVEVDLETMRALEPWPACPRCGGLARPNILMFGDWGWVGNRTEGQEQRLRRWMDGLGTSNRLVVMELGAGTAVPTVRRLCEWFAQETRGTLIRVNPREPEVPSGGIGISMGAREAIEKLIG